VRLVVDFMTLSNLLLEKCQPYLGRVRSHIKGDAEKYRLFSYLKFTEQRTMLLIKNAFVPGSSPG
ncbi:hypothetical protein Q4493_14130, partial [Colwellia sp. 1_MG-2023]|uniref:hypothetical protein n=1 Tax=Colwellia sp. 1_MG-2023 TaxID=3062649 RepID=UPI0026E2C59E